MSKEKTTAEKAPQEIWVRRKKANLVTICFADELNLRIFPGNTRISDPAILGAIANDKLNHGWKSLLSTGAIEIINSEPSEKSEDSSKASPFTAMSVKNAIKLIQGLYSIPELEQMRSEESAKSSRKSVLDAIEDQIRQLNSNDDIQMDGSFSPHESDEE